MSRWMNYKTTQNSFRLLSSSGPGPDWSAQVYKKTSLKSDHLESKRRKSQRYLLLFSLCHQPTWNFQNITEQWFTLHQLRLLSQRVLTDTPTNHSLNLTYLTLLAFHILPCLLLPKLPTALKNSIFKLDSKEPPLVKCPRFINIHSLWL